jgi:hypothetical protein
MGDNNNVFMGPNYNKVIDEDPQFIRVPIEQMGFASRKSAMPKNIDNAQTIKHVKD